MQFHVAGRERILTALRRPYRAAVVVIAHLCFGGVVVGGIWLTEQVFLYLWGEHEPKFFGWVPVKWLFDASELGVLILFAILGIYEAFLKLRGR